MINKRLIGAVPESKKYIAGNVALQWCSLCANIAMMSAVTALLAALFAGEVTQSKIVTTAVIALAAVAVRYGCTVGASRMGYLSSKAVVLLVCVPLIPMRHRGGTDMGEEAALEILGAVHGARRHVS